jgi:hypothetical protein
VWGARLMKTQSAAKGSASVTQPPRRLQGTEHQNQIFDQPAGSPASSQMPAPAAPGRILPPSRALRDSLQTAHPSLNVCQREGRGPEGRQTVCVHGLRRRGIKVFVKFIATYPGRLHSRRKVTGKVTVISPLSDVMEAYQVF